MDKVPHIYDYLEKSDFPDLSALGTRFDRGTLVVFCGDKCITIEDYFTISRERNVRISDFK